MWSSQSSLDRDTGSTYATTRASSPSTQQPRTSRKLKAANWTSPSGKQQSSNRSPGRSSRNDEQDRPVGFARNRISGPDSGRAAAAHSSPYRSPAHREPREMAANDFDEGLCLKEERCAERLIFATSRPLQESPSLCFDEMEPEPGPVAPAKGVKS